MTTEKQIAANRENGTKGGVKTPEGKAVSRLNARKHGIFASALTEHDHEELHGILEELNEWLQPAGALEEMLAEKLALTYLRLQRCARGEAEYHIWAWEEERNSTEKERSAWRKANGFHVTTFRADTFERSVGLFARYDAMLTNQFTRLLHEIERLQRMRSGQDVQPPLTADLTVHGVGGPDEEREAHATEGTLQNEPTSS